MVAPVLTRITEHRIEYTAALFRDIGFSARQARYRSLLAYSAHLGYTELARSAPAALPHGRGDQEAYLQHVLATLTTPASHRSSSTRPIVQTAVQ
jgi:hypothetical protein